MEVMALISTGFTQADACSEVGISTDTYRRWISQRPDAIEIFTNAVRNSATARLQAATEASVAIFQRIIDRAIATESPMSDADRLNAAKYVESVMDKLALSQGATSADEEAASEYLQGPVLVKAKSRMGGGKSVNVQIDGEKVDITVTDQPEILDGEFHSDDQLYDKHLLE